MGKSLIEKRQSTRKNLLLNLIKKSNGLLSRNDLCKQTHYSMTSVAAVIEELIDEGLVTESESADNRVGRRPVLLSLDEGSIYFVGVECNSFYVKIAVTNLADRCVYDDIRYVRTLTAAHILELLQDVITAFRVARPSLWEKVKCITVGVPGALDKERGLGISYLTVRDWVNVDFAAFLSRSFDKPLYFINNIDSMVVAYQTLYAADPDEPTLFLMIRNGVGMRMSSRRLLLSDYGVICEFGHLPARNSNRLCACGRRGCYDTEITYPAIRCKMMEAICANKLVGVRERCGSAPEDITMEMFMDAVVSGDPDAIEIFEHVSGYIGELIAQALLIFAPARLVLSYELCELGEPFRRIIRKAVAGSASDPELDFLCPSTELCAMGTAIHGCLRTFPVSDTLS